MGELRTSYVEHVVGEYYRKRGYFVLPRRKYSSPKHGWKDIDLIAIKDKVLVIECKGGADTHSKMAHNVVENFVQANRHIDETIPLAEGKERENILVVAFKLADKHKEYLRSNGVEVQHLQDLLRKFLRILKKQMESKKFGKDEDFVTRTLKALVDYELIKDDVLDNIG